MAADAFEIGTQVACWCVPRNAFLAPELRRLLPAGVHSLHVGKEMRDSLVAIDAGLLPRDEVAAMDVRRPSRLLGEIHGDGRMAVAAFQGIIRLQARPFVLRQLESLLQELLTCGDGAEHLPPYVLGGLHLA